MCTSKVLFSQGGFFFLLPSGENTALCGKQNILSVFSFPKNAVKAERLAVYIWLKKKKEQNSFTEGEEHVCSFIPLSWNSSGPGERCNGLWVIGPETCLMFCPSALFPFFTCLWGVWSLCTVSGCCFLLYSTIKDYNNLSSWPGAIIVPTCSASLKGVTKQMTVYILKCQIDMVALM